ncbi:MAG: GGDEF domain-containing protein [Spirochaetales bacterium]|nr:GGDEF domain-containing protein [Spirochaetales bacterium]
MTNIKYLFIIINQQEDFLSYFQSLKRNTSIKVEIIELENFFKGHYAGLLSQMKGTDLCVAGNSELIDQEEAALCRYLGEFEITPCSHLLRFFRDFKFLDSSSFISGDKAGFVLSKKMTIKLWTQVFQCYLFQVFHKTLLSFRLTDYIYHSFSESVQSEQLKKKNQEIKDLNRELEQRNRIDSLTQLYNRKALFDILEKERDKTLRNIQRIDTMTGKGKHSHREKQAKEQIKIMLQVYSVMMIDIDHFKQINDRYGHLTGDRVLSELGALILDKGIFRDHDYCARFGGEEFLVILPSTNSPAALEPAVRLQNALKKRKFKTDSKESFQISLSIGISQYHPNDADADAIIQRADKALYYAKEHGRDMIVIYEDVF